jgi:hypothetical protein
LPKKLPRPNPDYSGSPTAPSPAASEKDPAYAEIEKQWPDVGIPGYWETLDENCKTWANEISAGPFWSDARRLLPVWSSDYRANTQGDLVTQDELPLFVGKGRDRAEQKTLSKWRKDPEFRVRAFGTRGPAVPNLTDLVRNRISVRFLDGVDFLAERLLDLAKTLRLEPERTVEGRSEGYFAHHITFKSDVFFRRGGVTAATQVLCEVQIATDFSTRVWDATHGVYEATRVLEKDESTAWQWTPGDPRFISRQLGHMIHLADGLILQLRDSTRRETGKNK